MGGRAGTSLITCVSPAGDEGRCQPTQATPLRRAMGPAWGAARSAAATPLSLGALQPRSSSIARGHQPFPVARRPGAQGFGPSRALHSLSESTARLPAWGL